MRQFDVPLNPGNPSGPPPGIPNAMGQPNGPGLAYVGKPPGAGPGSLPPSVHDMSGNPQPGTQVAPLGRDMPVNPGQQPGPGQPGGPIDEPEQPGQPGKQQPGQPQQPGQSPHQPQEPHKPGRHEEEEEERTKKKK